MRPGGVGARFVLELPIPGAQLELSDTGLPIGSQAAQTTDTGRVHRTTLRLNSDEIERLAAKGKPRDD